MPNHRAGLQRPPLMMAVGSHNGTWPDGVPMMSTKQRNEARAFYQRVLGGDERPDLWVQDHHLPNAFNIRDDVEVRVGHFNEASEETKAHYDDAYYEAWMHIPGVAWPAAPPPVSDPVWQAAFEEELAKASSGMGAPGTVFSVELAKVNALNARATERRTELWEAAVAVHAESTSHLYQQLKERIIAGQATAKAIDDAWHIEVSWTVFVATTDFCSVESRHMT